MSPLDELAPGLWRFTVTRNGLPPTMTAYALRDGEGTILVDPLVAGETEPLLAAPTMVPVIEIDGELRVWPRHRNGERRRIWYEQRFVPTLDALTRLDVERVLVTHGEPVLRDGAHPLAASLARPPWSRSSLY